MTDVAHEAATRALATRSVVVAVGGDGGDGTPDTMAQAERGAALPQSEFEAGGVCLSERWDSAHSARVFVRADLTPVQPDRP